MRLNSLLSRSIPLALLVAACSSSPLPEAEPATASSASALDRGQAVPTPVLSTTGTARTSTWSGTASELLFADALATCTTAPGDVERGASVTDARLVAVRAKMRETLSKYAALSPSTWHKLRNDPAYNARPLSNAGFGAGLQNGYLMAYDVAGLRGFTATDEERKALQAALDVVSVNLCIARGVNEQMLFGATLLMTGADQRYLHEAVRERAQIAMLQLTDIFAVLGMTARPGDPLVIDATARMLRQFAAEGFGPQASPPSKVLSQWAEHLSDAVRLHVESSQRLAGLLTRSASAREPLPGMGNQPSNDDFGEGGYRQRVLALLYGGDPLAEVAPGVAPNGAVAGASQAVAAWPTRDELPVATTGLWTARAVRMMALSQQNNALSFVLRNGVTKYTSPADIDVDASSVWLFRDLEAALRTMACGTYDTTANACKTFTAADVVEAIPSTPAAETPDTLSAFRAFTHYGVKPSDARDLARALVDVMPSPSAVQGFHLVGGTTLETLPGRTAPSLKLAPNARFVQRSLLEAAAVYARMGRHHVPVDLVKGASSLPLEPIYTGLGDGQTGRVLDGTRVTGAIPALAALRETLTTVAATTNPAATALAGESTTLLALIDAAIGATQTSVRPVEERTQVGGATTVVQVAGAPTGDARATRRFRVRTAGAPSDPFFSGRATEYTLVAVANAPRLLSLLAEPKAAKIGFGTIDQLLAEAPSGNVSQAAMQSVGASAFEGTVTVPDGASTVVFVRRRARTGTEYRAITGAMRLWAGTSEVAGTGSGARPVDSLYFATGGELTTAASRAFAAMEWDPARPAYDGFGEARVDVPNRSPEINASTATMHDYVNRWMGSATREADSAKQKIDDVVARVTRDSEAEVNLTLAREHEIDDTRTALIDLCGDAAGQAGAPTDPTLTKANAACGISTMTIASIGSTRSELGAACPGNQAPTALPASAWATSGVTCTPAPAQSGAVSTEGRAATDLKCALDPMMAQLSFPVEVATPVACAQYALVEPTFAPVGGALQQAMLRQRQALRAYQGATAEMEAAALAALERAKLADEALKLSDLEVKAADKRMKIAEREGKAKLAHLSGEVKRTAQATLDAQTYYSKLTGRDLKDVAQACASGIGLASAAAGLVTTGAAIAAGAAAGSVVPGIGTAIGAVAGAAVAVVMALSGPSSEEKAAAEAAINSAMAAEAIARKDEADAAALLGVCVNAPCPPYSADDDTVMGQYSLGVNTEKQRAVMTRVSNTLALREGVLAVREKLTRVQSTASELVIASTSLNARVQSADLAIAKARLETRLVEQRNEGYFGISHAFHAQDMWAAAGVLETSRRSAARARKAIEFAYATDLSQLSGSDVDGLLVRAPAKWADQIFDYDLSSLRVVGLSDGPPPSAGIFTEKTSDYVRNLGRVADNYFTAYHVDEIASRGNSAYITGPASTVTRVFVNADGEEDIATVPAPGASRWAVECPARSVCAPQGGWCAATAAGSFVRACEASDGTALAPTRAKIAFHFDAWGQTSIARPPVATANQLNGRWTRFAINLLGDKISDKSRCPTVDQLDCGRLINTVSYELRSTGPFVATGADRQLRILPIAPFPGRGNAYAQGSIIDPRVTTFDMPPLSVDASRQFLGYPLEGNYELVLTPALSQDLGKIETVQILFEASYFQPSN